MIYDDGYPMDENLRVTQCPKCRNEQFASEAEFCRICGTLLYNPCEGEDIYDYNGNFDHHEEHRNFGNARFCEKCGKSTLFYKERFLLPYDEVRNEHIEQFQKSNPPAISSEVDLAFAGTTDEMESIPF